MVHPPPPLPLPPRPYPCAGENNGRRPTKNKTRGAILPVQTDGEEKGTKGGEEILCLLWRGRRGVWRGLNRGLEWEWRGRGSCCFHPNFCKTEQHYLSLLKAKFKVEASHVVIEAVLGFERSLFWWVSLRRGKHQQTRQTTSNFKRG